MPYKRYIPRKKSKVAPQRMKTLSAGKSKPKKQSRSRLIAELDKHFSLFIRQRDANEQGIAKCFTCPKVAHWKELQCGHYISRRHYSTRWDEKNCATQCAGCNIFNQGNAPEFAVKLMSKYGNDILNLLIAKKNNIFKASNFELELLIEEYKNKKPK